MATIHKHVVGVGTIGASCATSSVTTMANPLYFSRAMATLRRGFSQSIKALGFGVRMSEGAATIAADGMICLARTGVDSRNEQSLVLAVPVLSRDDMVTCRFNPAPRTSSPPNLNVAPLPNGKERYHQQYQRTAALFGPPARVGTLRILLDTQN